MSSFAQYFHSRICGVHSAIRRYMASILEYSNKLDDVDDFLDYVDNFASMLTLHHQSEDHSLFPYLSRERPIPGLTSIDIPNPPKLDFTSFSSDHIELHKLLEELKSWTLETRMSVSTYDPVRVGDIMTKIQALVLPHLQGEEDLISPDILRVHFSDRELRVIMKEVEKEIHGA
ncbi:hypothetical protein BJ742DRAFT_794676 [Cladochytrium replicatum]|nr:hypothetical protein BJ742DRAFT_794676 [Cladochytrium replicatum]